MDEVEDAELFLGSRINVIHSNFYERLQSLDELFHLYNPRPLIVQNIENPKESANINETYSIELSLYQYLLLHFTNLYLNVLDFIETTMESIFLFIMNLFITIMDSYRSNKGIFDFFHQIFIKFK